MAKARKKRSAVRVEAKQRLPGDFCEHAEKFQLSPELTEYFQKQSTRLLHQADYSRIDRAIAHQAGLLQSATMSDDTGAVQEVKPPVSTTVADLANESTATKPGTAKRPKQPKRETAAKWLGLAYSQYSPGEFPAEISSTKVQRKIEKIGGPRIDETTLKRALGRRKK
jgi:hypothetical protein